MVDRHVLNSGRGVEEFFGSMRAYLHQGKSSFAYLNWGAAGFHPFKSTALD